MRQHIIPSHIWKTSILVNSHLPLELDCAQSLIIMWRFYWIVLCTINDYTMNEKLNIITVWIYSVQKPEAGCGWVTSRNAMLARRGNKWVQRKREPDIHSDSSCCSRMISWHTESWKRNDIRYNTDHHQRNTRLEQITQHHLNIEISFILQLISLILTHSLQVRVGSTVLWNEFHWKNENLQWFTFHNLDG